MRRALALAVLGTGSAAPNPRVGAVVARGTNVIGQGYHLRPGAPHAETVALMGVEESGAKASGATLYTSLEPCCHTGRTPPCVDRIVRAGIARVVASMRDPNPRVNGGGFRALRRMGVRVEVGLLRDEALRLNEAFVKHARTGLPLVTLKGASSLDGRIATRTFDSKWITSASARRHARLLRFEHEAILVGTGTALADDPRLDRRPRSPLGRARSCASSWIASFVFLPGAGSRGAGSLGPATGILRTRRFAEAASRPRGVGCGSGGDI